MEFGRKARKREGHGSRVTAAVAVFLLTIFSVHSQNLVQNGDFDVGGGSFADWQISHSASMSSYSGPTVVSGGYNDPYYARFTFEAEGNDILSQEIPTVPGEVYAISFDAEDGAGGNFGTYFDFGNFSANLGPTFSVGPGEWYSGWTNFTFDVTATALETDLAFIIAADSGSEFGVDDISVVAVPELKLAKVGRTFQVTITNSNSKVVIQATTNMADWVNVCTNTAPCTFTDAMAAYPQRFYRAAVVLQK